MVIISIYKLTNRRTQDCYVGSTVRSLKSRQLQHFYAYANKKLKFAIQKFGQINFKIKLLERCENKNRAARERFWFNKLKPAYNIRIPAVQKFHLNKSKLVIRKNIGLALKLQDFALIKQNADRYSQGNLSLWLRYAAIHHKPNSKEAKIWTEKLWLDRGRLR